MYRFCQTKWNQQAIEDGLDPVAECAPDRTEYDQVDHDSQVIHQKLKDAARLTAYVTPMTLHNATTDRFKKTVRSWLYFFVKASSVGSELAARGPCGCVVGFLEAAKQHANSFLTKSVPS